MGGVIWDYIVIAFLSTGFGTMPENANKDHPNGTPQLSQILDSSFQVSKQGLALKSTCG